MICLVLGMASETSFRGIIGIYIRPSKSQDAVPRLGGGGIPSPQISNLSLGSGRGIFRRLIGTTDVGQLIVDSVGDDAWVKRFFLSFVDKRVNGLEGGFGVGAAVKTSLELHGRDTETEVKTGNRRFYESTKVPRHRIVDRSESNCGRGTKQSRSAACTGPRSTIRISKIGRAHV